MLVSGAPADKPSRMVLPEEPIELTAPARRFVSRGGEKLDAALDDLAIDVAGLACLDVGSSTGGFTDCLLRRGATSVVAVDVGRGQLDWSLRNDPRVRSLERTDVRDLDAATAGPVDLVVVDVSFISLRTVLPAIVAAAPGVPVVALCKPQFEVGRASVGKGGVVRDPELHERAVETVIAAAGAAGLSCRARVPSAVPGAEGNQEFFLHLVPSAELP